MQLLHTPIRTDWQSLAYPQAATGAAYWQRLRIVIPISVALSTVTLAFGVGAASMRLSSALLLALAAGLTWHSLHRLSAQSTRNTFLGALLVTAGALLTWLTVPLSPTSPDPMWLRPAWPLLLVALAPLAAALAWWLNRPAPITPRLTVPLIHLFIGALTGLGTHLHLLLVVLLLQPWRTFALPAGSLMIWLLLSQGGFFAVIEEYILRGPTFGWQFDADQGQLRRVVIRQALISLSIRLPLYLSVPAPLGICLAAYRVILEIANVILRQRCKSIWPGLAGNVIYSVLTAVLLLNQ